MAAFHFSGKYSGGPPPSPRLNVTVWRIGFPGGSKRIQRYPVETNGSFFREGGVPIKFRATILVLAMMLIVSLPARSAMADGDARNACDQFMKAMQQQDWPTAY